MTIAGGIYFVNPFNIQFPTLVVPDLEDENAEPVESSDDSVPEQEPEVQQVTEIEEEPEPVQEEPRRTMITNTLLHKDINFVGKYVDEVEVDIPEQNDGYLYSIISPDLNTFVDVQVLKNNVQYCDGNVCDFVINGLRGSDVDTYEHMEIPVQTGDNITFLIGSNPTGFSQKVSVSLRTMYERQEVQTQEEVSEEPVTPEESEVDSESADDIDYIERRVHALVNEYRIENGLSALSYDAELVLIARGHSQDMAENDFFDHDNLRGMDPTARAEAAGYSCYKDYGSYYTIEIAENIWQGWLYDYITYINGVPFYEWLSPDEIAEMTVGDWISSQGHRENILTSTYDREGIGVAIASDDKVYITQNFC